MSFGLSLGFAQAASAAGGPSLSLQFVNATTLDPRITFTRASSATYFNSSGVLTTASTNEPRFDFNPITLVSRGLLIEDARTNLLLNSATLSTQSVTVAAVAHTLSFYGTGTVTLSGASTAGPLVGTGVFPNRVSLVFTPTAGTLTLTVTGTVQYAQLEEGDFASSYIPTTGAAATRQKDVALITTLSPWYNSSESTLYAEAELPVAQDTGNRVFVSLSTTSINDSFYLFRGVNHASAFMSVSAGGAAQFDTGTGYPVTANTIIKIAGTIKANDAAYAADGADATTDNVLTMPATATRFAIGVGSWTSALPQAFAWFRQVAYYPRRLANAELKSITASTIVPAVSVSRLSGTAPLAIHFDATGTTSSVLSDPFRQATYAFDYGDPSSGTWSTDGLSKNTDSGGPIGAHVYEAAGVYRIRVAINDGVNNSSAWAVVTVNDPDTVYSGTNTICIDPTGGTTGGPTGCQYVTSMPTIISNRRYLIRRGQTISSFTVPSTVTGVRIGAYGTGAKPIVNGAIYLNNNSTPTVAQWVEDVVVADLDVRNGIVQFMCGRNITLLRCTLDLPGSTATSILLADSLAYYSQSSGTGGDPNRVLARSDFYIPKYVFVVECYQRGVDTDPNQGLLNGIWGSVDCAALMGNDSYTANQHLLRFYVARKALVQHCIMADRSADGARQAIKLQGTGLNPFLNAYEAAAPAGTWISTNNIIRNNTLGASDSNNDWTVVVAPQNTSSAEGVQDTILENNAFINSPGEKTQDIIVGPSRRTTTRGNTRNDGAIRIDQNNNTYVEPIQSSWRGPYYGQYPVAQTLSPSLFTNSSTFYAPTVTTTGVQVIQASRLSSTFGASPRSVSISSVGSGSTVVVLVNVATVNQGAGVSVTDNQGNTYTQDLSFTNTNSDGTRYVFRASNVTNAPTSISCAFGSGSALITFDILEISGLANVSPVDATVADTTSTANSTPSKSITTTTNNCFVVSYLDLADGRTFTPAAGWTALPSSGSNFGFTVYDDNVGAAGSKTVSGTLSSSVNWRFGVVAYKPV